MKEIISKVTKKNDAEEIMKKALDQKKENQNLLLMPVLNIHKHSLDQNVDIVFKSLEEHEI